MRRFFVFAMLLLLLTVSAFAEKRVALTFDDGPSGEITGQLLDGLEERGVHATFFLCGYRMDEVPEVVHRIAADGHELGIHGYTHAYFTRMDKKELRREIEDTAKAIQTLTGQKPTLLRPPGGLYNDAVLRLCREDGYPVILWTVDPEDWNPAKRCDTVRRVVGTAGDGDIILLHDLAAENTKSALTIVDQLIGEGFSFYTVTELAEEMGSDLHAGEVCKGFSR